MQSFDIVYVTYNSSKWIEKCVESITRSDYDLKKINVFVVDNASTDDTVKKLKTARGRFGSELGRFEIIRSQKNNGFGKANNIGFAKGESETVCFFNIDTELNPDTLSELDRYISASDEKVGLWELRQFPYEHPKFYNPLTRETSWSSGAAFATKRVIFDKVGGFDEAIFMYAEDVDLSWRIRSFGYKIHYVAESTINHYSYDVKNHVKPNQYLNSICNNLLLRYRFGSAKDMIEGNKMVLKLLMHHGPFPRARRKLAWRYLKHFFKFFHFRFGGIKGDSEEFAPEFRGFDYSMNRQGEFYMNSRPKGKTLVSIIVRTCGRPDVLRETLISIRNQTYKYIETVIVEDGAPKADKMIETEFSDMNIIYKATGTKVGRSKAGNIAMSLATGKYLNFLDDDDLFYADHVEVLVNALEKTRNRVAYSFAFETPVVIESKSPYVYEVMSYNSRYMQKFSRLALCHHNYIPIQSIMFEKTLFDEHGGLDETVDALEDWDIWVRYAQYTAFSCVGKTTSLYKVPFDSEISDNRQNELDDALDYMRDKHKQYTFPMSVYDYASLYEEIRGDLMHVR